MKALLYLRRTTDAATMNDPGLEEPLKETENRIEEEKEEEEIEQEIEQTFLNPRSYRLLPSQLYC